MSPQANTILFIAGATLALSAATGPAQAKSYACTYKAMYADGRTYLGETAVGLRKSAACTRAYRQCRRKIDRIRRKNKLPRGITGCVPLEQAGNPQPAKPQRTNSPPSKPRPGASKPASAHTKPKPGTSKPAN